MAIHNILGKEGEEAACEMLIKKGYIIRERNWRCGKKEIDIIAQKNGRIVIVEVKTRSNEIDDISKIIDRTKIANLVKAGNAYLQYYNLSQELQFDIMLITAEKGELKIEHIEDAIMPPMRSYR